MKILIILILLIILICIAIIIYYGSSYDSVQQLDTSDLWPYHLYITKEHGTLKVHYMKCANPIINLANSTLKAWYFNKLGLNCRKANRKTLLFIMNEDNISAYRWVLNICEAINLNLCLVYIKNNIEFNDIYSFVKSMSQDLGQYTGQDTPEIPGLILATDSEFYISLNSGMVETLIVFSHGDYPQNMTGRTIIISDVEISSADNVEIYYADWTQWRSIEDAEIIEQLCMTFT
jgi:hypothetical protein